MTIYTKDKIRFLAENYKPRLDDSGEEKKGEALIRDLGLGRKRTIKSNRHLERICRIADHPDLLGGVLDGTYLSLTDVADMVKFREKAKPSTENLQNLSNSLVDILDPVILDKLFSGSFIQRSLALDYIELSDLIDSLNKTTGKKVLNKVMKLFIKQADVVPYILEEQLPDAIKLAQKQIELDKEALRTKEKELMIRYEGFQEVVPAKDLKLLIGCFHPDKLPEDKKERFGKAFITLNKLIGK